MSLQGPVCSSNMEIENIMNAIVNSAQSRVVSVLQSLIRIPSPNPPGDCRQIAEFCCRFLRDSGFATELLSPDGRAWSVVGCVGEGDGPTILYHAHIDTVPLGKNAQWGEDPYAGVIVDGRVYGLGSVDDKACLAAILQSAADFVGGAVKIKGRLVVVCAADEEVGGQLGTKWLVESGYIPRCDFVVVGEQTRNKMAVANKGVLRATFHVAGRTAHATDPGRGCNAINGMAHLIVLLEQYEAELGARPQHPLLGSASINIGVIEGGVSANVVADACAIRVDRRMIPREDPSVVISELQDIVALRQMVDPTRVYRVDNFTVSKWFETSTENQYLERFLAICSAHPGSGSQIVGYLPGSDAKHLVAVAGQGMVVFGPGSYEVSHATDEYVEIGEVDTTYRILLEFVRATIVV